MLSCNNSPNNSVTNTANTTMNFRSMNDIVTTQRVPLGGYSDASAVEATASNNEIIQPLHKDYNMEKYTLDGVPEREYEVANFIWSSDTGVGGGIKTLNFPQLLFQQDQLADIIKKFSLMRAGIRLIIRISATPELFGAMQVSWCPDAADDPDSKHQLGRVRDSSLFPHVIVSAASGAAVILDMPFVSTRRALDLHEYRDDEIARVVFKVMAPLTRDDMERCTARVIVSAQFLDPAFMLPTSKHNLHTTMNIIEGSLEPPLLAEPQSNPRDEATNKSEGAVSSVLDATVTLASAIERVPLVGEYAGLYKDGAKVVSSGLKSLGLCKPNTLNYNAIVRSNPNYDHNLGEGICTATPCGISAENAISTEPNLGGVSVDEMALSYIVQTPSLVWNGSIMESDILPLPIQDMSANSYVDVIRRMFDYASGSYKFAIYFFASKFMVGRFAIYLEPDADSPTTWSDCYHQIVEVQGDTLYTVTVPYIDPRIASWNSSDSPPRLRIIALSIQSNATNTPIYLAIYKAGSSDFQFYCPVEWGVATPQSNPREVFSDDFKPMHPTMTGYKTKNLIYGDEVTHLKQLLLRLYAYNTHAQNNGLDVYSPPSQYTLTVGGVDKIYNYSIGLEAYSRLFKYYRGSVRMKSTSGKSSATVSRAFVFKRSQGRNQPTIALSNLNDSNIDCVVPYCYPELILPTNGVNINKMRALTTSSGFLFKGAGDDYSLHFLRGLPIDSVYGGESIPQDRGINAFVTYMTIA